MKKWAFVWKDVSLNISPANKLKMDLRWTEDAANDLERITNYLFEKTPQQAPELVRSIHSATYALCKFPLRGRPGKKRMTRELVLSPLPYLVVYQVLGEVIHVIRILHGAQKWP